MEKVVASHCVYKATLYTTMYYTKYYYLPAELSKSAHLYQKTL